MTRTWIASTLILFSAAIGGPIGALSTQSSLQSDDSAVLQLVIEEVWSRAGHPILHNGRDQSKPIFVVQGARPVCRKKVYERDRPWPLMCGGNPLPAVGVFSRLPPLTEHERSELIRSYDERNTKWQDLPPIQSNRIAWLPRQEYIDGAIPQDLAVVSLPGYSGTGRAVVGVSFSCGNVCGTGWVALLDRSPGTWKILAFLGVGGVS